MSTRAGRELAAFVHVCRQARRKRHGAGKAPIGEAIMLGRCAAYIAGGSRRQWLYPHSRAFRRLARQADDQ
jgi:hypothetical protein